MLDIKITKTTSPKEKPADESKLGFGKIFTDHMFLMDYTAGKGWYDPRIVAHGFDFGAFEGDAGFQGFKDEIIMPCFSVFCYYFLTHGVSSSSCLMISCWRMVSERRCERRFSACARWR